MDFRISRFEFLKEEVSKENARGAKLCGTSQKQQLLQRRSFSWGGLK